MEGGDSLSATFRECVVVVVARFPRLGRQSDTRDGEISEQLSVHLHRPVWDEQLIWFLFLFSLSTTYMDKTSKPLLPSPKRAEFDSTNTPHRIWSEMKHR